MNETHHERHLDVPVPLVVDDPLDGSRDVAVIRGEQRLAVNKANT